MWCVVSISPGCFSFHSYRRSQVPFFYRWVIEASPVGFKPPPSLWEIGEATTWLPRSGVISDNMFMWSAGPRHDVFLKVSGLNMAAFEKFVSKPSSWLHSCSSSKSSQSTCHPTQSMCLRSFAALTDNSNNICNNKSNDLRIVKLQAA